MRKECGEYFGKPDDIQLIRRSEVLWTLLRDDPRYAFFGRMIFLNDPDEDGVDRIAALAGMQGAAGCQYCAQWAADDLCAALRARGLTTSRYEQCRGGDAAVRSSREILARHSLPEDLSIVRLDRATAAKSVADVAELSMSCGVIPVSGSAMRGVSMPGICLLAVDSKGATVATASAHMSNHPDSPHAKDAFWGKLATREDRRGQHIGLLLGAQVIVSMWQELGARAFFTGVKADNPASMKLCNKLGVTASNDTLIVSIDPETLKGASFTR